MQFTKALSIAIKKKFALSHFHMCDFARVTRCVWTLVHRHKGKTSRAPRANWRERRLVSSFFLFSFFFRTVKTHDKLNLRDILVVNISEEKNTPPSPMHLIPSSAPSPFWRWLHSNNAWRLITLWRVVYYGLTGNIVEIGSWRKEGIEGIRRAK